MSIHQRKKRQGQRPANAGCGVSNYCPAPREGAPPATPPERLCSIADVPPQPRLLATRAKPVCPTPDWRRIIPFPVPSTSSCGNVLNKYGFYVRHVGFGGVNRARVVETLQTTYLRERAALRAQLSDPRD